MVLCGIPVADRHVLDLARELRDAGCQDTAGRLETGYEHRTRILALTINEREEILSVLGDCPDGLCELRSVLLQEKAWRLREGL